MLNVFLMNILSSSTPSNTLGLNIQSMVKNLSYNFKIIFNKIKDVACESE